MSEINIYQRELDNLEQSKLFLKKRNLTSSEYRIELEKLIENYEDIVSQSKVITKISDRLQKKLDQTNEKLYNRNIQLQDTIDELTKTKISRKATTIVFIVAIILFLILESIIEPYIEKFTGFYTALFIKLGIALLIKPAEMLLEHSLLKKARKEKLIVTET
ncbi:MAG: hypothetical protein K8R58_02610 [Bacteroidales bacterium]|nr:hypothetical protein [Bacteroidales bacterium]